MPIKEEKVEIKFEYISEEEAQNKENISVNVKYDDNGNRKIIICKDGIEQSFSIDFIKEIALFLNKKDIINIGGCNEITEAIAYKKDLNNLDFPKIETDLDNIFSFVQDVNNIEESQEENLVVPLNSLSDIFSVNNPSLQEIMQNKDSEDEEVNSDIEEVFSKINKENSDKLEEEIKTPKINRKTIRTNHDNFDENDPLAMEREAEAVQKQMSNSEKTIRRV